MQGGYIVLSRNLFDHPLWLGLTDGQRCVLIATIEQANWKPGRFWSRTSRQEIEVPRGSFITTQSRLAQRAKVTRKVVRSALDQLEAASFLSRRVVGPGRGHGVTMITVTNYSKYQDIPEREGRKPGHFRDSEGVTNGVTKGVPIEPRELKEPREPVRAETPLSLFSDPSLPTKDEERLADLVRSLHLESHPDSLLGIKQERAWLNKRGSWAKAFSQLRDEDGKVPVETIERAVRFAYANTDRWGEDQVTWCEVLGRVPEPCRTLVKNMATLVGKSNDAQPARDSFYDNLAEQEARG